MSFSCSPLSNELAFLSRCEMIFATYLPENLQKKFAKRAGPDSERELPHFASHEADLVHDHAGCFDRNVMAACCLDDFCVLRAGGDLVLRFAPVLPEALRDLIRPSRRVAPLRANHDERSGDPPLLG